jgi:hypothetical protein
MRCATLLALLWYKSTNTDADVAAKDAVSRCGVLLYLLYCGTKVQILTQMLQRKTRCRDAVRSEAEFQVDYYQFTFSS